MRAVFLPTLLAVFAGLLVWSSFGAGHVTPLSIVEGTTDFEELATRFEALARERGGAYAFDVLRQAPLPPNIDLHLIGHRIGDILYEQEGTAGIALCTDDFRNACSHSIVVGALTDSGESALPEIREACKRAPGGPGAYTMCYHGLGHGVLAFYEYSMPETATLCMKTGTPEYREHEGIECVGGAVMELSGGGGHDREAWLAARDRYIEEDPLGFCLSDFIPETAKAQCLTYMTPELWKKVGIDMGNPDPRQYPDAFALCARIPLEKSELRYACYGGFGKEFIPLSAARDIRAVDALSDEAYARVLSWCDAAGIEDGVQACTEQALHSIFWGGENDPAASFRFCALVSDAANARQCYETLGRNIAQYLRGDSATRWCAQLPEYARALCSS
jgi:hypothetical protein